MSQQNFLIVAIMLLLLLLVTAWTIFDTDIQYNCNCNEPITDGCITLCTGDIDPADPLIHYEYYEEADYNYSTK